MSWLIPALVASLVACWFAWSRGAQAVGVVLLVVSFGLLFLLGRRIEAARESHWQQAASQAQGTLLAGDDAAALLATFGARVPWTEWAHGGPVLCPKAIAASGGAGPAWLLDLRYTLRESRGEESSDQPYEIPMAVVRLPGASTSSRAKVPVDAGAGWKALHNGQFLFVWHDRVPGAPRDWQAQDLLALLAQARQTATQLFPAAAAHSSAAPAGPVPASPRTPPR